MTRIQFSKENGYDLQQLFSTTALDIITIKVTLPETPCELLIVTMEWVVTEPIEFREFPLANAMRQQALQAYAGDTLIFTFRAIPRDSLEFLVRHHGHRMRFESAHESARFMTEYGLGAISP